MQKQQQKNNNGQQTYDFHSKYNIITYQMRKTLIQMVQEEKNSIYKTAKILNMKNSTAKAIIRKYRRQGHIFKRKRETVIQQKLMEENKLPINHDQSQQQDQQKRIVNLSADIKPIQQSSKSFLETNNIFNSYLCYYIPFMWTQPDQYCLYD